MRTVVQEELAVSGQADGLPLITTSVITDGAGIAEAAGWTWWFALTDDGAGGTTATVTGREAAPWVS